MRRLRFVAPHGTWTVAGSRNKVKLTGVHSTGSKTVESGRLRAYRFLAACEVDILAGEALIHSGSIQGRASFLNHFLLRHARRQLDQLQAI